jgi:catechol 2,3-dioxygenase-like lactoylglutathione lyase family enzyme
VFSHVTVGTRDLPLAIRFYDAVLTTLGLRRRVVTKDGGTESACWVSPFQLLPRFYVYCPFNGSPATAGNGAMVAFTAPSIDAVVLAFRAGIAAGGTNEGVPGERAHYGHGYYGAYLRDLDANKVHLVYRGDLDQPL